MAQAQILYVGTSDGLVIFSNPGRSQRWLRIGHELRGRRILALRCDADQPLLLTATTDEQAFQSNDGGQSWKPAATAPQPALVDQVTLAGQPPASLRSAGTGIERSQDEGHSWQPAAVPSVGRISLLMTVPYHPDLIFAGSETGAVLISSDRGRTWLLLAQEAAAVTALAAGRAL